MSEVLTGADFKNQLRAGNPKMGLFLNGHSPTVAEQLAHSGYDWLLVDTQHGPMGFVDLSAMLAGIQLGGVQSDGARGGLSRPRRHPAGPGHGRGRRAGSLHQHSRGGSPGRKLRALSNCRNALGILPTAQHEQGGAGWAMPGRQIAT